MACESWVDKKDPVFQILGICALITDAASDQGWRPFPHFIFLFSPFWEPNIKDQDIQKQLHIRGELESDHTCSVEGSGLEKPEKTLSFHLTLLLGTETEYKQ